MKYYRCLRDNAHGRLTKGKIYAIKKDNRKREEEMYIIDHYDNENSPGPLNGYWFDNFFKLIPDLSKNIKIL
jgi:hypothetical protein